LLLDPPAALKLQINKKGFCKAALIFFASFFLSREKMKLGLPAGRFGQTAQYVLIIYPNIELS